MKRISCYSAGFTLLELVVTVGIVGLLVAAGVPAFYAYGKQNAPRIAAQDIKNALLEAQSLARSPAAKDAGLGYDYYYVTIQLDQDNAANNGNIWSGKGKFITETGQIDYSSQGNGRRRIKIDPEAWITKAEPMDVQGPNDDSVSYYFIIPTGEILFNGLEPSPGFGYSPLCKIVPAVPCSYAAQRGSTINVSSTDAKGSTEPGGQTIIIDGNGGNVNIVGT